MPFVTFTVRRGLSAADKSRLSEAMLEAQVAETVPIMLAFLGGTIAGAEAGRGMGVVAWCCRSRCSSG
jgi:ribosome-binding ATPase YchF (GTP1/OBG family)